MFVWWSENKIVWCFCSAKPWNWFSLHFAKGCFLEKATFKTVCRRSGKLIFIRTWNWVPSIRSIHGFDRDVSLSLNQKLKVWESSQEAFIAYLSIWNCTLSHIFVQVIIVNINYSFSKVDWGMGEVDFSFLLKFTNLQSRILIFMKYNILMSEVWFLFHFFFFKNTDQQFPKLGRMG